MHAANSSSLLGMQHPCHLGYNMLLYRNIRHTLPKMVHTGCKQYRLAGGDECPQEAALRLSQFDRDTVAGRQEGVPDLLPVPG